MPPQITAAQRTEIATIASDPYSRVYHTYGGNKLRPNDDFVTAAGLQRVYEVYADLLNDPHCFAVWQKRVSSVIQREWVVEPGGARSLDKKAADLARDCLGNLSANLEDPKAKYAIVRLGGGFDQVSSGLMSAIINGRSFAEILWDYDGKYQYPREIVVKPVRRFELGIEESGGYKLLLLTNSNPSGTTVPPRKFISHFFEATEDSLGGQGLGRKLYWAVYFKRQLARFSLAFADKYGSPGLKGTYPAGNDLLKNLLLEAMAKFGQETGVVLPNGCTLEMLDIASGKGPDVYNSLIEFFNREMSKCILGETGSTDQQSGGGSRARDQIGNEVRIEISKADADLLSGTLNRTLLKWITEFNFKGAATPKVWRRFPELDIVEDLNARSQRDNTISSMMGVKPTRDYITRTYGIELEEEKPDPIEGALGQAFGSEQSGSEGQEEEAIA